jgi:predicted unusual protein kinase regulating ubiquinone biosynthesis (AarF/ABC1/UbiB family)
MIGFTESLYLDFLHEARNAERCREHLKHLDYVYIPKVYWNLTKKVRFSMKNLFE